MAAWNIHMLIDRDDTKRPHRCTTLIASELDRYKIDIAALSETRLAELTEKSLGNAFFLEQMCTYDNREARVGYAIKTSLVTKLACPPKDVNDHLMTEISTSSWEKVCYHHQHAYASTMTNTDETKDKFYEDFKYVISTVPTADKIIIIDDFNARVGQDNASWKEYWVNTGPENATTMAYCFFRPALSLI